MTALAPPADPPAPAVPGPRPGTDHTGRAAGPARPAARLGGLVDAAFAAGLCLVALVALRTTFAGWTYLAAAALGIALGLGAAAAGKALRAPLPLVALLTAVLYFLAAAPLVDRADCAAGLLPSLPALRAAAGAAVLSWKQLLTTAPPVTASGALLAVPLMLGLAGAAGCLTPALRLRAAAAPLLAPLALLGTAIALGTTAPGPWTATGVATAALCLIWSALRARRARPAAADGFRPLYKLAAGAAVVAVAAGGAALAAPALPGGGAAPNRAVLREKVVPPLDLADFPSPLVGFRKYTRDADQLWDSPLFTVSGAALPAGTPIRIATLDDYDGSVWGATNGPGSSGFQRVGGTIAPDPQDTVAAAAASGPAEPGGATQTGGGATATGAAGPAATVRITIDPAYAAATDLDAWLPTAGGVTGISFSGEDSSTLTAAFRYNAALSSGLVLTRLRSGDSFTLTTDLAAASLPSAVEPYGPPQLRDGFTAEFSSRAATWAKGATGIGPQLTAIAAYLRSSGAYSDGGPGESQYLPGHSIYRLTNFLNGAQPVGDDEQYAAAYALLANSLGMPARVVLGAIPEPNGVVEGKDVHAWVEIHVASGAWVRIPDSSFMPDASKKPNQQPPQRNQDAAAAPVPPPNAVRPPTTGADRDPQQNAATPPGGAAAGLWSWIAAVLAFIARDLWPALLLAGLYGGACRAKALRRKRRRGRGTAAARFSAGWRDLVDHARDLGLAVPEHTTRSRQARAFAAFDVAPLAHAADAVVYGPGDPTAEQAAAYWSRLDEARRATSRAAGRKRRLLAPVSLRSVRRPRADAGAPGLGVRGIAEGAVRITARRAARTTAEGSGAAS